MGENWMIPLNVIGLVFDIAGVILIGGYSFRVLSPKHLTGQTGKKLAKRTVGEKTRGVSPDTVESRLDIVVGTVMLVFGFIIQIYASLTDKPVHLFYLLLVVFLACLIVLYFWMRERLGSWRMGKTKESKI